MYEIYPHKESRTKMTSSTVHVRAKYTFGANKIWKGLEHLTLLWRDTALLMSMTGNRYIGSSRAKLRTELEIVDIFSVPISAI